MEETGLCLLSRDACKVNYIILDKVIQMTWFRTEHIGRQLVF
jgi:hypothetical protein